MVVLIDHGLHGLSGSTRIYIKNQYIVHQFVTKSFPSKPENDLTIKRFNNSTFKRFNDLIIGARWQKF